jgi:hypothetical protein
MRPKRQRREDQAAFVMEAGDRFHLIIVSEGVRYEADPGAETVITFFVIRRDTGLFDICNVNRTFAKGKPVSRTVQTKEGIPPDWIAAEIDRVRIGFALGIEKATGYKIKWHDLDLSDVCRVKEQIARIKAWGRVGARTEADLAKWN